MFFIRWPLPEAELPMRHSRAAAPASHDEETQQSWYAVMIQSHLLYNVSKKILYNVTIDKTQNAQLSSICIIYLSYYILMHCF